MLGVGARAWIVAAVLAIAPFAVGACGGDDDSEPSGPDPAALAPSDALVYAEAEVRPDDEEREDVSAAIAGLLGEEDAGAAITRQVDALFSEGGQDVTYEADIEPWLGETAGVFFTSFADESDGAFVVATTDETAAQTALDKLVPEGGRARDRTYEGVSYKVDEEDDAAGIVDGFAVLGSEAGFRAAVDASSGESLADSSEFEDVVGDPPDGSLISAYALPEAILDALVDSGEMTAAQRSAISQSAEGALDAPVGAFAGAGDSGLFVETSAASGGEALTGEAEVIERAPDDAWLAFGLPDAGRVLEIALPAVASADPTLGSVIEGIGTSEIESLVGSLGAGAAFVSGESVLGIGGGVVLETDDEAAANSFLGGLERALSTDPAVTVKPGADEGEAFSVSPAGVPIEFPFVVRDGLLAAALGRESVEQIFSGDSSITDSDAYEAASDALGDDFSLTTLVDFEVLTRFFQGIPDAANDPDFQAAFPYLERMDVFAIGGRTEDDRSVARFILDLRE